MSEKIIPRKELKQLYEICTAMRDKTLEDYRDYLGKRFPIAEKLAEKSSLDWLPYLNLMDSILGPHGFNPDATFEDIERVLSVLGWQVSEK
jgi:hypothetical protein